MSAHKALAEALVDCVSNPDRGWSTGVMQALVAADPNLEQFAAVAGWHRCDGAAWLAVKDASLADTTGGRELADRYVAGVGRHLRSLSDLGLICEALAASEIPFVVFKGPVVAEQLYNKAGLRFYGDVDILVAPSTFARSIEALEGRGCVVLDANWTMLTDVVAGQIHLATPLGTVIDLHWNVVNEHALRKVFPIPTQALLDRSTTVDVRGNCLPTLDPVDTLVHLCLHASMAGANRLGWLKDVERAGSASPQWLEVVARTREWGAGSAVGVALARSRHALAAPVPAPVLAQLTGGPGWRALTKTVDRLAPVSRVHDHGSVNRIVARAARSTGRASTLELGRRAVGWARDGGPFAGEHDPWKLTDSRDPRAAIFPSGDRATYVSVVERQT
ncbi:MAG TPA: nucleotidyltransferase family protein [Acidothermaceae bacterium]|jgi:hypothetical protein|nr:nucleotidyltransferase family protein [Acidothermaceae bacterium]